MKTFFNKLNGNMIAKGSIKTVFGILKENITQAFNIQTESTTEIPYLLAAQIKLTSGVWSDMRTLEDFARIDNNSTQVNVIKTAANKYAGYQVRFMFLVFNF